MKNKFVKWTLVFGSLISLVITMHRFYNVGIYSDEFGSSPVLIFGGEFGLYLEWVNLFLIFGLFIVSIMNLHSDKEK